MKPYQPESVSRPDVDVLPGVAVLEFGTNWCGVCAATRPHIEAAFADYPAVRHIRVEDGKGLPLGRSYGIKLWPTLIFLSDGKEMARLVRPENASVIETALAELAATNQSDG